MFDELRIMKNACGPQDCDVQDYQWKFFIGPPEDDTSSLKQRNPACASAWALFNGYSPALVRKCMRQLKEGDQSVNIFDQQNESTHERGISNLELMPEMFVRSGVRDNKESIA